MTTGLVKKTENEYDNTVGRLLKDMRLDGDIPYHWIIDNTRWTRIPMMYANLAEGVTALHQDYRRDYWQDQNAYVAIWLEKEALAGVFEPVTAEHGVPLMVTKGYSSLSFLYEVARGLAEQTKPAYLYYFGDRDPSGLDIPRNVHDRLEQFAPGVDLYFKRVAVTAEQIRNWALPTRPTKRSDSRSKEFEGESVELDAIPPKRLRWLVEQCIVKHIDWRTWEESEQKEKHERELTRELAQKIATG